MRRSVQRSLIVFCIVGWTAAVGYGAMKLWNYGSTAGVSAHAPATWPGGSRLSHDEHLPTLLLTIHPHCPCTQATLSELAKVMTQCAGKVQTTILVVRPAGMAPGWERTDLLASAEAIPGVRIVVDEAGTESRHFGAATSGQALLYGADGRLQFAGGITESRGHAGDNAGESAIVALVLRNSEEITTGVAQTPVYGCALFDKATVPPKEGCAACQP